jgi:hypothetical protein
MQELKLLLWGFEAAKNRVGSTNDLYFMEQNTLKNKLYKLVQQYDFSNCKSMYEIALVMNDVVENVINNEQADIRKIIREDITEDEMEDVLTDFMVLIAYKNHFEYKEVFETILFNKDYIGLLYRQDHLWSIITNELNEWDIIDFLVKEKHNLLRLLMQTPIYW